MGFVNETGKTVIPFEYDRLKKPFPSISKDKRTPNNHFSWFLAQKNGLWGGIDSTGKWVTPFEWETAKFVNDTIILLSLEGLVQLKDPVGQVWLNEKVDAWAWADEDNFRWSLLLKIEKNGKTGVINHRGKVVAPVAFNQLLWCRMDGFVCGGNKDLKKAMFSRRGEQVAPLQLAEMQYEGNGLFWMVKDRELSKTGLIDTACRTLMPFEFAECRLVR